MNRILKLKYTRARIVWINTLFIILLLFVGYRSTNNDHTLDTPHSRFTDDNVDFRMFKNVSYLDSLGLSPLQREELNSYLSMPRYPRNGTGVSVNITYDFEPRIINVLCSQNLSCVIPVYSAVDRFVSRISIRESLGRLASKFKCKVFFIVGVSKNISVNENLKEEYKRESDILVIDKLDTYRDLNNKAFAMIKWLSEHCLNVPYAIHLIDDTYINLKGILGRLHSIHEEYYMLAPVSRHPTTRHHPHSSVTEKEYPYRWFPHNAYGWVTAFPTRIAPRLLSAVFGAYYCWIEDVWIGGHVRIAAGVKFEEIPQKFWKVHLPPIETYGRVLPDKIVIHGVQSNLLARLYNEKYRDSKYLP